MESQFTSPFWHYYIVAIVVASFIYVTWLLLSQDKVKLKKGEEVKTTGHSWDGIEEYNNPMPRWWFWMFIMTILFGIGYLVAYPGMGGAPDVALVIESHTAVLWQLKPAEAVSNEGETAQSSRK